MAPRALKLGTRRSALARVQSALVARQLEQRHPGLRVELVSIDTRGDRIVDRPLSTIEGKEFFTAEIDAALLRADVDFTVHSCKDLSLERTPQLRLAAVPERAPPQDVVVFTADAPARLAAGEELVIGSSSPRRASFVPEFLCSMLPCPSAGASARVRLVDLRGNVDSRLRRLHEPRGAERHLDAVVLAFAGLTRLWEDQSLRPTLGPLLSGLPRMVLPLSACPAAPAQGALALECRSDDAATAALLATLDHGPTRDAVRAERELLSALGGGCQQPFGATMIEVPGLGRLLYAREAAAAVELRWMPAETLPPPDPPVRAWDGSCSEPAPAEPIPSGAARAAEQLQCSAAVFIVHRRALPGDGPAPAPLGPQQHVWVPGLTTWRELARRGVWVEGCAEGLGIDWLAPLLAVPWLQLPPAAQWTILTHERAAPEWGEGRVIATYRQLEPPDGEGPPAEVTHVFWNSGVQFERWGRGLDASVQHACGPGRTYEHLREAGVRRLRKFPGAQQWREWLQS